MKARSQDDIDSTVVVNTVAELGGSGVRGCGNESQAANHVMSPRIVFSSFKGREVAAQNLLVPVPGGIAGALW
ncbi:MAG: hypothetical protein ACI9Y1_003282 [Lentisphaeria bacterium]|jgi:hypothetical protein